jgi:DNA-binding transcriptional MerR regulator/methylmalonyl-CoA mutase cobalamin-binding subunit
LFKVEAKSSYMFSPCQVFVARYYVQAMYNIKQAAARAGVSVPVLRAWERRYGIVRPGRSASGYRQFDDDTVARIRTMRGLVDAGWSPSAAAAAILDGRVAVTESPSFEAAAPGARSRALTGDANRPGGEGVVDGSDRADADRTADARDLADRLVAAATALDARAVDAVLDELFSRGSFEQVADALLFPALQRLGDAWAAGVVSVAGEHLASNAVLRRLGLALDAAGSRTGGRGRVIIGLPPGAHHELGALAFAVAARRAGLPVSYLGPDLPVDDWITAADGAAAAVVGVVTGRERRAAMNVAHGLRHAHPDLIIAVGGARAPDEPGVLRLPASLPASVEALAAAIDGRAAFD